MRIIGGAKRGLRLAAPEGKRVRPTSDRAREAIFNILASRAPPLPAGAAVLDLFAGTGAFGLEALSRGAAEIALIDNDRDSAALIERNLAAFGNPPNARLLRRDVLTAGKLPRRYDLIFLDPPYESDLLQSSVDLIHKNDWLADDGLIIAEAPRGTALTPPTGLVQTDRREYGIACFFFLMRA